MQFNKKYAIRKLAVGVASVAIGFAVVGVNPQVVLATEVASENFGRTNSGNVDTTGETNLPKPTEEVKSVPNGEKNFNATVAFTTEAGLGSGTLVSPDTVVTVAHNFVHLNEKTNPISVENNVNKDGDVHIATLPNGDHSKFSNADVHYWNRDGFVQGYKNDLAVVKLKNSLNSTQPAEITETAKKLENGDKIHVFGYPKGKLEPIVNGTVENTENYGANIYGVAYQGSKPGASGGGLYDADGKLIGVNQNGVEGLRSGGITFSKEQLDWINSIVRGENAKPVYLNETPKTDNKEEVHPKHGRLLYTDENVTGMVGKLYEDGTYIMKSNGQGNMLLDNPNQGVNAMFYGLTDKDGQPLSAEEVDAIKNKVKRIEVDGEIVADKLATDVSNNTTELDLTGVTLSDKAEQAPFLAYYADNLTKLTLDSKLSLSNVKNVDRIIDNAPNLKLTNEQATQLLKDTKFENSDGIFNNVGVERLDLTSFDNSKLNNNAVLFKNLKELKEIAFGDKFNFDKYVPTGQSNSYFDTDLSTVEQVSGTDNSTFIKEWVKAVKDANIPKKEAVYKDGVNIGTLEEVLNKTTFEKGVYTIGKTKKVIPEPKVEYLGRGKDIVRKTTTYRENPETGDIEENVKEEVNPEVNMHFYFVYSIRDENGNKSEDEYRDYKGVILKEEEYIPEGGKWLANSTLHGNSNKGIDAVVKWPRDTDRFEYNGEIYKVVGSSVEHIISGPDSNDTERSNYERDSKIWHEGDNLRLFYGGSTSPDAPQSEQDYVTLNELGLAKDGKVVKAFLYVERVRGSYTQTFIDEDQAKAHENDENYNPEDYSIKEKYFSGYHKLTEDFVLPKAPQHIQKDNKIYKLSSYDFEPTMKKYKDGDFFTEYKYKVLYENTTKEEITKVEPKDVYVGDESRDRTSENIKTNGTTGITKTITTYKVDNDGNLTEEVTTPEKTEVVNNVIKVGTKPKVEYFVRDDVAMKKTTTYTVNSETGEVTEKVQETTIGRAKDKVKTTPIPSPRVYQKDSERELNMPNEVIQGEEGSSSVNITYTLNKETGELTENQSEPVVKNPTPTIIKVAAKDKVVYSKKGNDIIKTTTTYDVNENNGEITSNTKEEVFKVDGVKDKVVVEDIAIPTVYVKDSNKEKGQPNMIVEGELGKKTTTTTYDVNPKTGEAFEAKISTDIKHPKDKRIYVPAKDKVERFEKDNKTIEKTTIYNVNPKTGDITESSTEKVIKENTPKEEAVNLHYYIDYYIPSSLEEWRNGSNITSKLIKSIEYNRPTKWIKGEDLTNGLYDGVEKTVEYNGIKYKQVGLESTRRITNETTNNTETKEYYDNYNSNWRVGTEPVFKPTVAEEGGVYRLPVFLEPQVGWITQKFYSEEYNHHKESDLNAEDRYKLKDDVVLPLHSIDDKVEVPNAPQYIQKSNRIYKLVSNDPVPKQYEVANNSISYFYKNLNLQSTEKTVETQPVVKYKADDSRERNSENIRIDGKPKITQIITNPKVTDDGNLSEETFEEVVQNSVDTIVKIGTKPKVEYTTKGKNVIKTTTSYSVNENTGEVTETTTSEIVDTLEGLMPPVLNKDEYKEFVSTNTPVDENGELILPPVVEIPEYKDTSRNTQPTNDNNQKPDKLEEPQNVQQSSKDDTNNTSEVTDNKVVQKQTLPKTNALHSTSYILGLLLSTIGLKRNKKD